ncbi:MAG: capsular biosynthesis protein, partial [Oscillospiraceae bacterium]|nr:capsular biosynthesis protein [Oscillospiraceae bacterium]
SEDYDYVFLDTPPVNVVTDSQLMNTEIAGLVFIIRESSTIHPDIQNALEKIRLANGKALGFVKTFCKPEKSGRYGKKYGSKYGYKYGYGYGYSSKSDAAAESTGE